MEQRAIESLAEQISRGIRLHVQQSSEGSSIQFIHPQTEAMIEAKKVGAQYSFCFLEDGSIPPNTIEDLTRRVSLLLHIKRG